MRKLLSFVVACTMAFGLVPTPALAEAVEEVEAVAEEVAAEPEEVEALEAVLEPQGDTGPQAIWLESLEDADSGTWMENYNVDPMQMFRICASDEQNGSSYSADARPWQNATDTILFTSTEDAGTSYAVMLNSDRASLDGLFYEEDGLTLPLPAGSYTVTFMVDETTGHSTASYAFNGVYTVDEASGFVFKQYYRATAEGKFTREDFAVSTSYDAGPLESVPFGGNVNLNLAVTLKDAIENLSAPSQCFLKMYAAEDDQGVACSLDELEQQFAENSLDNWPNPFYWNATRTNERIVWHRTTSAAGSNDTLWSLEPSSAGSKTGVLSIQGIDFSKQDGTNQGLEPGIYFPVLAITVAGQEYRYAYNPIEVAAANDERQDPTITTSELPSAMRGVSYATTLAGRTGAPADGEPGTLTWYVTDGALPAGLSLDENTGTIAGTPTKDAQTQTVTITLAETIGGEERSVSQEYTIVVYDQVTLGYITYTSSTIWNTEDAFDEVGNTKTLHLSVPITQDLREETLNLQGSTVYYRIAQTSAEGVHTDSWGEGNIPVASVLSADGKTLEIDANQIQGDTKTIDEVEVSLYLGDNDGNAILAQNNEQMKITRVDQNPSVSIGGWMSFEVADFEGEAPTDTVRVRMWPVDENNQRTGDEQIAEAGVGPYESLILKAAPGKYAFVLEGAVAVLDDEGNPVLDGEGEPEVAWVDMGGSSQAAVAITGTDPQQFTYTLDPRQSASIDIQPSVASYDFHTATCLFETETSGEYETLYDGYEVRWYRYVPSRESDKFVLVGTGRSVSLERSNDSLFVEVVPTGRNVSFWKSSGKQRVSQGVRVVEVQVPRKKLFRATLHLSNPENRVPAAGDNWGIVEVKTPLESYGYTSQNSWATSNVCTVGGVTAGSIITYTPPIELLGGSVSYTVPEDAEDDIEINMDAPLPKGLVDFGDLSFVGAREVTEGEEAEDEQDAADRTTTFSLDDGQTVVKVATGDHWFDNHSVPFYIADGNRIVLQDPDEDTFKPGSTYSITVRHYDQSSTQTIGLGGNDYVASKDFVVTLDQSCQATSDGVQIVSPGSAVVPLVNPDGIGCELLLYSSQGDLVDVGAAGTRELVCTPLLAAGDYTLYAVDMSVLGEGLSRTTYAKLSDLKRTLDKIEADERQELEDAGIEDREPIRHWSILPIEIADGTRKTLATGITFPRASSSVLVNRKESAVTVASNYAGYLNIQMHAELLQGAEVPEDAYLLVDTNQTSGNTGAGFTNVAALNINGHAIAISRWSDLFAGTQNMANGSLKISLAEAAKTSADCKSFPMDMTLVIPRTTNASTEVRVWLVANGGQNHDLVGSCEERVDTVSLTAPTMVAWDSFSVYGETRPYADVAVYLNGMRAGDTRADEYGFYTTQVWLPSDVDEWEEFTVSASAQWTKDEFGYGASSVAQTVTYTTEFPVVEKVTMFYQPDAGKDYVPVESYYRGAIPAKYRTFYRGAMGKNDLDAKYFWMVEFANGADAKDVYVNVPRSEETLQIATTDSLTTAKGWIVDLADLSQSAAGKMVRAAMQSDELRTFVCQPTYLSYCPSVSSVTFDVDIIRECAPYPTKGIAPYKGLKDATADGLTSYLEQMSSTGKLRAYAAGSDVTLDAYSARSEAEKLVAAGAENGNIDQWLLLTSESDGDGSAYLTVQHQVRTTDQDVGEMRSEVQGIRNGADAVVEQFETWLAGDKTYENSGVSDYKDKFVVLALGTNYTFFTSDDYLIVTEDKAGSGDTQIDTQIEEMYTYSIDGAQNKFVYQYLRADKQTFTCITWNEETGQRVEVTYTIPDDELAEEGWDGQNGMSMLDVGVQWTAVQSCVRAGFGQSNDVWWDTSSVSTQSDGAEGFVLSAQDGGPVGSAKGRAQDLATKEARKQLGIKSDEQLGGQLDYLQSLKDDYSQPGANKVDHMSNAVRDGNRSAELGGAIQFIKDFLEGKAFDGLVTAATADVGSYADPWSFVPWDAVDDAWRPMRNDIRKWIDKRLKESRYKTYRAERMKEIKGHFSGMNALRDVLPKDELEDFEYRFRYDLAEYDAVHWPNGKVTHDPSGIVYEDVLSNPVEGATVRLYTYNAVGGVPQFLDSTKFGIEENPQVTGADGRYQWFVPEGYWQVRVTKDGYEDFSTGSSADYGIDATKTLTVGDQTIEATDYWMPVLPIQLDVNIGLVSKETPKIGSIEANQAGAVVTFNKYVVADSVTADLFTVNGSVPASIEAVDAEAAGDGSGVLLARTFRLAYAGGALVEGVSAKVEFVDNGQVETRAGKHVAAADANCTQTAEVVFDEALATKVAKPKAAAGLVYTGKEQVGVAAGTGYMLSGTVRATKAGSYVATAKLASGYVWADGSRGELSLSWSITRAKVAAPEVAAGLVYTGKEQVGVAAGTGYALSGTVRAINAGTYTAYATPDANHCWADGTTGRKTFSWTMAKAANPMTVKAVKRTVKQAKVRKKKQSVAAPLKFTKKAQGTVSYARVAKGSAKCLSVNKKTGKVTVKKGTKKGTYKVKIKVTSAGNGNYNKATKTITCKVVVK